METDAIETGDLQINCYKCHTAIPIEVRQVLFVNAVQSDTGDILHPHCLDPPSAETGEEYYEDIEYLEEDVQLGN